MWPAAARWTRLRRRGPDWAGLLGRDGHLDRLPTERGAYPEFYRILAAKIADGGAASALPVPVDPAGPVEVLQLIEQAVDGLNGAPRSPGWSETAKQQSTAP